MQVSTNWLVLQLGDKLKCNTSIVDYVSYSGLAHQCFNAGNNAVVQARTWIKKSPLRERAMQQVEGVLQKNPGNMLKQQ